MALNPSPISKGKPTEPLASMTKLSDSVYLTRPPSQPPPPSHPKLILLLGWVSAAETHLAKYLHQYATLCPHTPVLLIKARVPIMGSPKLAAEDVAPAIPVMRQIFDPASSPQTGGPDQVGNGKAGLHIHLFSNGGSNLLYTVRRLYARPPASSPASQTLPLHTTIFDSTPSTHFTYWQIVLSITTSLPQTLPVKLAYPLVHLVVFVFWVLIQVFGGADPYALWSTSHNDPQTVKEDGRLYMYSDTDALVSAEDVEAHARGAEARGFKVRKECFRGSGHVAHARSEGGRYWGTVREMLGLEMGASGRSGEENAR